MPPQSRGSSRSKPKKSSKELSGTTSFPDPAAHPTLAPFLDNLPSPSSSISDQRTPQANPFNRSASTPTPIRTRGATIIGTSESDASDSDPTLDDADFQSHYSVSADISSSSSSASSTPASPIAPSPSHLHLSASARSLPLYPPFYNRPPTPLPPSPSLTSLLRPPSLLARSTTSTRPTTPDSSDDADTPNDTEAAVAQSARRATPVARAAPKVPTYEYYGFVVYLASSLAFALYLAWSFVPSPILAALGVHYYPNRWWSLAIPAFLVMCLCYIYVALACYNVEYLTLPMESLECLVDEAGMVAVLDRQGRVRRGNERVGKGWEGRREWRKCWSEGTDAVMDVPVGGVCEVLYGEERELDEM